MQGPQRKALEYLSTTEAAFVRGWDIPNGRGYTHLHHATEKTLNSIEDAGWAVWTIARGWIITEAGRAALRGGKETGE